ncbi:MAG: hypothetical protein A2073_04540 [Deltaproteobacteria bacterium GWC2_42_11]|nr:MAG: hypothetical protein A2073_04540 [Deltaproteobacteria bacterium GWC2_42_11]
MERKIIIGILVLSVLGFLLMSVNDTYAQSMTNPIPLSLGKGVSVERGAAIFAQQCATCHGLSGRRDGPRSFSWTKEQYMPDLSVKEVITGRDEQLFTNIKEGLARFPEPMIVMPQWKYILSDEDIWSVIKYIQTLPRM